MQREQGPDAEGAKSSNIAHINYAFTWYVFKSDKGKAFKHRKLRSGDYIIGYTAY